MKKKLVIGFGLIILISCNGNQNEYSENKMTIDSTKTEDKTESNVFPIFDFPQHWYALDGGEDGSDYYINQWCDSDTRQVLLEKDENNAWSFTFNYGQEQTTWKLMNFEATSLTSENESYVEGSFSLTPIDGASVTPDAVEFYWNQTEKWCDFNGDVIGDNRFVNEEEKDSYKLVEEDCSDYWQE